MCRAQSALPHIVSANPRGLWVQLCNAWGQPSHFPLPLTGDHLAPLLSLSSSHPCCSDNQIAQHLDFYKALSKIPQNICSLLEPPLFHSHIHRRVRLEGDQNPLEGLCKFSLLGSRIESIGPDGP